MTESSIAATERTCLKARESGRRLRFVVGAAVVCFAAVAHAQFASTAFQTFEVRGPNSIKHTDGPRVTLGAFGVPGIYGTAYRPAVPCGVAPESLPLFNQGNQNIPTQAFGSYPVSSFSEVCLTSWNLALAAGGQTSSAASPSLAGLQVLPFVSNNTIASSADGKIHTFNWTSVASVDGVRLNIWDRATVIAGGDAQLVTSLNFAGNTTSFSIDLGQASSPYLADHAYTLEVSLTDTRDDALPRGDNSNILSRSRTYFDFVMPSVPVTTAPVFLPITVFDGSDPTYVFTVTVSPTGTFVIDPDVAIGYIYETAAGNPNFRTVSLPKVGNGRFLVELFDIDRGRYDHAFIAKAGETYKLSTHASTAGVAKFRVKGIESSAALDSANPRAFPTSLGFTAAGQFTGRMIPLARYVTSGLLPPTNLPPSVNTTRAGKAMHFRWTLADLQGNAVTDEDAVETVLYKPTSCSAFTTDSAGALDADRGWRSSLRYDRHALRYVFRWKTPREPGCYSVFFKFDTGQTLAANVMLTKRSPHDRDGDDD